MKDHIKIICFAALAFLAAAFITDCATATPVWQPGTITDKIFEPARTWTDVHTDKSHTWTETHYVQPIYYLVVRTDDKTGRMNVGYWTYDRWSIGDACMVQFRKGHIMTYGFLSLERPQ